MARRDAAAWDAGRLTAIRWAWPVAVTAMYAAVVVWGAVHHEPWRDEVVPLSIARAAHSLGDLIWPLHYEGHPILWYLLLWAAYAIAGKVWVLKVASVASATAAVFLFNRSPVRWWLCGLFTFSFFPVYQYSVISRGYSLEMLLLFAFCALHPSRRRHPLAVAAVLAALANTESFGLIMAVAAAGMLIVDGIVRRADWRALPSDRWLVAAAAVYVLGLTSAALVAFPSSGHTLSRFGELDPARVALGVGRAIARPVAHAASFAVLPVPWRWIFLPVPSAWVWAYLVYLTRTPPVFCFAAAGLVGIEVLFNLVYGPGAPWHVGNVLLVLVAAMWLDASGSMATWTLPGRLERARTWLGRIAAVGLTLVLAGLVLMGARYLSAEARYDYTSSGRLADLLAKEPALQGAVVMGEPDTSLWSLSYYADNRIYLPREQTFRAWGIAAPPRRFDYDLGSLLDAARSVHGECACPVVVTLGLDLDEPGTYRIFPDTAFEETFLVTPEARQEFLAAVRPIASFRGPTATDERYDVFLLR